VRRIFDAHVDTLLKIKNPAEFLEGGEELQLDIPRAESAGVTGIVTAICSEAVKDPMNTFERGFSNYLGISENTTMCIHLMVEGCQQLLEYHDRNMVMKHLSVASLTWNGANSLAGGIGTDRALTASGRRFAMELHESGVVLDVSHLCDRSRYDLFDLDLPLVATHCNCRAVQDDPRNLPDEDLKEIASRGGVVGITFVPSFLGGNESLEDIVAHLEHLVEVTGPEAAGFGSDFDGVGRLPAGIEDCTCWPDLFEVLDKRGWRSVDLDRVAGENWRRVIG